MAAHECVEGRSLQPAEGAAHRRRRCGAATAPSLLLPSPQLVSGSATSPVPALLQVFIKRNSVYVATIIVGAFVGERVSGTTAVRQAVVPCNSCQLVGDSWLLIRGGGGGVVISHMTH